MATLLLFPGRQDLKKKTDPQKSTISTSNHFHMARNADGNYFVFWVNWKVMILSLIDRKCPRAKEGVGVQTCRDWSGPPQKQQGPRTPLTPGEAGIILRGLKRNPKMCVKVWTKCLKMPSKVLKCLQMPSNAFKCLKMCQKANTWKKPEGAISFFAIHNVIDSMPWKIT